MGRPAPAVAVARALVGGASSPPQVGHAGGLDEPFTGASTTSPHSEHFNNRVAMTCCSLVSPTLSVPPDLAKSPFCTMSRLGGCAQWGDNLIPGQQSQRAGRWQTRLIWPRPLSKERQVSRP